MSIDQDGLERCRLLLRDADDVSAISDGNGQILWLSESIEQLTGWLPGEVRARPFIEFIHPDDQARVVVAQEHFGLGEPAYFEVRFERKDGGYCWFSILSCPVRDAAGALIGGTAGWRDIDDAARAREVPSASEKRFRLLAETASDIVYAAGLDRRVTWVAPAVTRALGWSTDEIVGTFMSDLVHPEDMVWSAERRDRIYAGELAAENAGGFVLRVRTNGGDYRWVTTTLTANRDADGIPVGWTGGMAVIDEQIEERDRAVEAETMRRMMGDAGFDAHMLLDPVLDAAGVIADFVCFDANRVACDDFGRTTEEMSNILLSVVAPGVVKAGLVDIFAQIFESNEVAVLEPFHFQDAVTGSVHFYDVRITPISSGRLIVVWRDVTEAHVAAALLANRATHDDLTRVLKREPALEYLRTRRCGERSTDDAMALLFVDLDGFKNVNDTWGHSAGDALLCAVTERIRASVRGEDVIARVGGDEFIVILDSVRDAAAAAAIADKLRDVCAQPVATSAGPVSTTLSIGVVLPSVDEDDDQMIARADRAMYEAKLSGRNRTVIAPNS